MKDKTWNTSVEDLRLCRISADHLRPSLLIAEARIVELEAHGDNLDKSLTLTEAELKAAIETLERVNGRAQTTPDSSWKDCWEALRDIRAWCEKGLRR